MKSNDRILTTIKVVAICGSLRNASNTHSAIKIALQSAHDLGAQTTLIDLKDYELVFVDSMEEKDYPADIPKLRNQIMEADAILIGTPEFHGSISGVLKTALDLLSKTEFRNKIVGIIGVAGGQLGAIDSLNCLRTICTSLHAWVLPQQVSISESNKVFDKSGNILNISIKDRLLEIGRNLVKVVQSEKCTSFF